MKIYLICLITAIPFCISIMVYDHLTYVAPANIPEWQLPGIADGKFVFNTALVMSALLSFLLYIYKTLPGKK